MTLDKAFLIHPSTSKEESFQFYRERKGEERQEGRDLTHRERPGKPRWPVSDYYLTLGYK